MQEVATITPIKNVKRVFGLKQKAYIDIMSGENPPERMSEAMARAGYSDTKSKENRNGLLRPEVQNAIKEAREARERMIAEKVSENLIRARKDPQGFFEEKLTEHMVDDQKTAVQHSALALYGKYKGLVRESITIEVGQSFRDLAGSRVLSVGSLREVDNLPNISGELPEGEAEE